MELVNHREDKRALRLVCKRTRASVDSRVVGVRGGYRLYPPEPLGELQLSALVRAPWQLQRLYLSNIKLGDADAAVLAAAPWPSLRELNLNINNLGPVCAAALAAAAWPSLRVLELGANSLGDAGAAALAAARFPALQSLFLFANGISSEGRALLQARWPTARISVS